MASIFKVLSVVFLVGASPALAQWPADSAALGARDHPKVLQRYGGQVQNQALSSYVAQVGAAMVAVSGRPDERWTFTVLDSPEVNAFALPGGYVYVTRGLLALATDESELAAVLAHEISHVVEAHVEARQEANKDALVSGAVSALVTGIFSGGDNRVGDAVRSGVETAFGQIGAYSKEQEFAADAGGIELLRAAGYRPAAQADFLATMVASGALAARIAGRDYTPDSAPIFGKHPAPVERRLRALALAGDEGGVQNTGAYLAAINSMIYGQNARQGFVLDQVFVHTTLGFTFEAAEGLRIQNAARQINILGPNRSTLILSGGADEGSLREALGRWAGQIPETERLSRGVEHFRAFEINGLEAATGSLRLRKRGKRNDLQLTVIRFGGGLIRFAGTVQRGDDTSGLLHLQTVTSFAALGEEAAAEFQSRHISYRRVEAGETVASIAGGMALNNYREEWFRVINGLQEDSTLQLGMLVKLVSY